MANDRNKLPGSPFPVRQPSKKHLETSRIPVDDIEQELKAALAAEDGIRALEVIETAPRKIKKQPEFMLIHANVLQLIGEDQQAFQILREIERKHPRFTGIYLSMALFYMEREWPAHALQAAKRAQSDRSLNDDGSALLSEIIEEATASIKSLAAKLDLPFETTQQACIFNERAQMAMDEGKLTEADSFCREAIKIAPDWNAPHNNRAQALYFSGKMDEAISVSEAVLAREAENSFALSSLVTYSIGLNRPEQARDYASRLGKLIEEIPVGGIEIEHAISAFALMEDTPALWEIAKGNLDAPSDSLFSHSWLCLAVAAIRNGEWKDALKLLRKADEEELPPAGKVLLDELKTVVNRRHPHLAWMPPVYPGIDLFFQPKVMAELEDLLQKFSELWSPSYKRKFNGFFQKYPFMVTAMKRLLWDKTGHPLALEALSEMDRTDADDEIYRFGLSQTGSQETRLQALMTLVLTGRYTGPKIVKLWDEDLEEWRDIELNTQKIGAIKANARPETMSLVEKANRTKDPTEAISLLQKAVEKEPTSPIAIFNLGVLLVQNGRTEEGETLIYRSVEVDPNYTFGHASIALTEAVQGHEQEALDHLESVTRADAIAPDTAVLAHLAQLLLAVRKHDLTTARQHFEIAAQILPNHHLLDQYEDLLIEAEDFEKKFGSVLEYQRKSAQRAHQKLLKTPLSEDMDLLACLEMNTKEMLVGCARFLQTTSAGKKGELVFWLARVLLNPQSLQRMLFNKLTEKEREALQWILEADGVRPWKEFVRKYGDDMDEPVAWNYHEPESIPGRLRRSGIFYSGTLAGQMVAFIPANVRPLLRKLLK